MSSRGIRGFAPASAARGPELPDISGLAAHSPGRSIAVKDTKMEDDSKRVVLLDNRTGQVDELDIDWSKTGRARDLEAIAPGANQGDYLAVEGSSFGDFRARLFELKVGSSDGQAVKSHVLPYFGQEVEGLHRHQNPDGSQTVVFGGRGDENGKSKLFWGTLSGQGLSFTDEGLEGRDVQSPILGPGQRSISELSMHSNGELWAAATIDEGDTGPFQSQLYSLGRLDMSSGSPELRSGESQVVPVSGTKVEAMHFERDTLLVGSDNELLGGRFEQFTFNRDSLFNV